MKRPITLLLSFVMLISFVGCDMGHKNAPAAQSNSTVYQATNTEAVWIPRTGSKYHNRSYCSNMKNPTKISRQEAEWRGYEPCKNCY